MPGGRLTAQDRERVASGLAEGLGYAEIARRLGRPTSTISREVARNGGLSGYRAARAHEATRRRARRRMHRSSPEAPAAARTDGRDPDAVQGFMQRFVALMVQTGLPRMAARVFACLVTTDSGALTAAELVRQLRVSPASVSKAITYLDGLDLVRRERAARRRERYVIDDDLWLRTWVTDAQRHATWASTAQQGVTVLGAATPAGARLDSMAQFFAHLATTMAGGPLSEAAFDDVLTIFAALIYASAPLRVDQLAAALDWPVERVTAALRLAGEHPDVIDPLGLHCTATGLYTITASRDRLTPAQRDALALSSGSRKRLR